MNCIIYTVHWTLYTVQRIRFTMHCTLYTVNCKMCNSYCTLYTALMSGSRGAAKSIFRQYQCHSLGPIPQWRHVNLGKSRPPSLCHKNYILPYTPFPTFKQSYFLWLSFQLFYTGIFLSTRLGSSLGSTPPCWNSTSVTNRVAYRRPELQLRFFFVNWVAF